MAELICHLLGDYCFQNHRMAARKTSSWLWAAIHVAFYMLPFLFLRPSLLAFVVMAGTHLVIDRFRLAKYWVGFWGVGCEGKVTAWLVVWWYTNVTHPQAVKFSERFRSAVLDIKPGYTCPFKIEFEPPSPIPPAPDYLAVWLLIIVDNAAHLTINHFALLYL